MVAPLYGAMWEEGDTIKEIQCFLQIKLLRLQILGCQEALDCDAVIDLITKR